MFESIYCSYPFSEDWEKQMCKKVLTDAREWGEKQRENNNRINLHNRIAMMQRYNK